MYLCFFISHFSRRSSSVDILDEISVILFYRFFVLTLVSISFVIIELMWSFMALMSV